jgi:uncharacterized OB-fold protein
MPDPPMPSPPMPSPPRPAPDAETEPFWAACRRHELRIQRCGQCGAWRFPPRPRCPECRSPDSSWERTSGWASIASWTLCYPPVLPAFAHRVPYNAIVVELDEGPFMVSNLVDYEQADLAVGRAVEVTFTDVDDEFTLPQFRPRH